MVRGWRAFGTGVAALALLAGCGSSPDGGDGATTTTTTTDTGLGTLGTEPTDTTEPTEPTNGSGVITVAGARLDGRSDTSSWPRFPLYEGDSTRTGCKPFYVNDDTSVPVTVDVSLSDPAVFELLPGGTDCSSNNGDCRGFTFQPTQGSSAESCRVNVRASRPAGDQARAALTFTFEARCPSTAGKPCDDPRVAQASPTPDNPVVVTWRQTETLTAQVFRCRATDTVDGPGDQRVCPTTTTRTTTTTPTTSLTTTSTRTTTRTTS
ncbi:hypothetical protein [Saccharothrix sp. NRRL B-16314]|uniref:hypothetical protein n=1 Tax=Saccharothrix sp. NRRL B-16314 TaxID=1463825 RepID=UPI0005258C28|nr:hypothetical protein [Saccharothrix sp. NRRL B-16314]